MTDGQRVMQALQRLAEWGRIVEPFPVGLRLGMPIMSDLTVYGVVIESRTGPEGRLSHLHWDYDPCDNKPQRSDLFAYCELDLGAPAVLGFLLAWLREATGRPRAYVMYSSTIAAWVCVVESPEIDRIESYRSDVDALVNALCGLAGVHDLAGPG